MIPRLLGALATAALLTGCDQAPASPPPARSRLAVVASFYPLYEFARRVGGDDAEVVTLVPPGVEPHDWEPAPRDVARLERAQLFIYNGAGFEPWADKLLANIGRAGPVVVVATDGIELLPASGPRHDDGPDKGRGTGPRSGGPRRAGESGATRDPHVWLDPVLAQRQVETIRAALAKADPARADRYATGARTFGERLRGLGEQYVRGLARCQRRELVVSHASFAYLARRYGLTQVPVMGLSPDSEPSPARLAELVRFARRHDVKALFVEPLVSPKLAETLAREIGARTLVLNPIEGVTRDDEAAGRGYVELMEDNLKSLRIALECA